MTVQRIKLKIGRILKVTSLTTKDPPIDPMERHVLPWKRHWVSSFKENGRGQSLETEANCFMTLDSQQLSARTSTNALYGDRCPFEKLKLRKCLDLGSDGVFLDFREAALLLGSHVCCVGQAWSHLTTEMKSIKAIDFLFVFRNSCHQRRVYFKSLNHTDPFLALPCVLDTPNVGLHCTSELWTNIQCFNFKLASSVGIARNKDVILLAHVGVSICWQVEKDAEGSHWTKLCPFCRPVFV